MIKFIVRRLIQSIPTLMGITILAYFVMWAAPGNQASLLIFDPAMPQKQREMLAEMMGANDSMPVQYVRWLIGDAPFVINGTTVCPMSILGESCERPVIDSRGNIKGYEQSTNQGILRGDFGRSSVSKRPVTEVLEVRIPATLELGALSLLIGTIIGITVGIIAAVRQGGWFDQVTRIVAVIISAIPVYWLGLILLLVFGAWLQLLPMGNRFPLIASGEYTLGDRIKHLILPTITLASFSVATFSRFMRASLLDVLNQDYVRTARAKGLSDRLVWFKHASRNALVPIATLLGPAIPGVITGAVLTETIYSWPGMGRLIIESVNQQDYQVIMAVVLIAAVATILGYLLSDIMYAIFDPRIRLS